MIQAGFWLVALLRTALTERSDLALENLALRQQLAILHRTHQCPRLRRSDRLFWLWLSRSWRSWRQALVIVKPETVVGWHRKGFALYWTRISNPNRPGRPQTDGKIRELIREMANANPLWGAPRVHGELAKLGINVSERTVSRLMPRRKKSPSQTWKAFLDNHLKDLVSIDFFTVPTATFRVLFVLIVLAHCRRRVVHFNVTEHPTASWTAEQLLQAFPWDTAPRYLLRDRDSVYGEIFRKQLMSMEISEVLTAPRSPWQNPYCERMIGSIRRECLNHVIVLGQFYLGRILKSYFSYYHQSRTHLSHEKDSPEMRAVQPPRLG